MSRTHTRAHIGKDDNDARRRTKAKARIHSELRGKSHKHVRSNDRAALRKEYR